ncbi:hypothetical protein [Dactylosporangium sp. CA-233914]
MAIRSPAVRSRAAKHALTDVGRLDRRRSTPEPSIHALQQLLQL